MQHPSIRLYKAGCTLPRNRLGVRMILHSSSSRNTNKASLLTASAPSPTTPTLSGAPNRIHAYDTNSRNASTTTTTPTLVRQKGEGDISSVFASLSSSPSSQILPDRFIQIKRSIVGSEGSKQLHGVYESWKDLLGVLREEIEEIIERGNQVIPIVSFDSLKELSESKKEEIRKRGVCVVRGVFKVDEALGLKERIKEYVKANPGTRGFPPERPQVYELYWSPSQVKARADPRMMSLQRFFLSLWHDSPSPSSSSLFADSGRTNLTTPLTYADRLRIRLPSDSKFALGPHVDGGGVERWEDPVYRSCYRKVFEGRWREFDPFFVGARGGGGGEEVNMNMYECQGGCSVFRAWQGWLSMSSTGPGEGTLRVLPLTKSPTAYWLLRPFFSPSSGSSAIPTSWEPTPSTPILHGVIPGKGQEMNEDTHPNLQLGKSMVSIPRVEPGDVVMWQGDLIHAVESVHAGKSDSSVLYIPAAPDILMNRAYVQQQRESFLAGLPPVDFPGGKGESEHAGRAMRETIEEAGGAEALRAMGF